MSFSIQKPEIFWDDFIANVERAKTTVSIRVMQFENGARAAQLAILLKRKLQEGVKVTLFIDWVHGKYVHGEIDLLPTLNKQKQEHNTTVRFQTRNLLEELRVAGASVSITNIPSWWRSLLPISGRDHTKIYITDDIVWIGGIHPVDCAFENIDFMVKMDSPKIKEIFENYTASNKSRVVSALSDMHILFDGGKIGDSPIYKQAISSIEKTKQEIIFMGQFVPDGALLNRLIKKAKQGVAVKVITSSRESIFGEFPQNILYKRILSKTTGEKNIQFIHCDSRLHAKLLIIDRKLALFGSHNFVSTGVWLGTKEVCIASCDSQLIKDFMQFIFESVPQNSRNFLKIKTKSLT